MAVPYPLRVLRLTPLELVIVLMIIAILAAILIPMFATVRCYPTNHRLVNRSKEKRLRQEAVARPGRTAVHATAR